MLESIGCQCATCVDEDRWRDEKICMGTAWTPQAHQFAHAHAHWDREGRMRDKPILWNSPVAHIKPWVCRSVSEILDCPARSWIVDGYRVAVLCYRSFSAYHCKCMQMCIQYTDSIQVYTVYILSIAQSYSSFQAWRCSSANPFGVEGVADWGYLWCHDRDDASEYHVGC